jgi:lysyl-tRNA synthetase, class I
VHWSEYFANKSIKNISLDQPIVIGSGISLSGPVHIGHSREFLTAYLIYKAVQLKGHKAEFIAFADDMDPLRKVYPFLPQSYTRWVGCPLYRIPDPFNCHSSYADHFLAELLEAFEKLEIKPKVLRSSELYNSGSFLDLVKHTLSERHKIADIISSVTNKKIDRNQFWPFQPECPDSFSIRDTRIIDWDGSNTLRIFSEFSKSEKEIDLSKGGGKLIWRCDWPMRWAYLGITVEPFGHDHNSSGGSYESGAKIASEIYNIKPPIPVPYSWVHFKSGGAMHSSSGRSVPIVELAKAYPPEVIHWMVARRRLSAVISFDPCESLLEEAHLLRQAIKGKATDEDQKTATFISQIMPIKKSLISYSYKHLAMITQLANFSPEQIVNIVRRSPCYSNSQVQISQDEINKIRNWIEQYGEHYKIRLCDSSIIAMSNNVEEQYAQALKALRYKFVNLEWEALAIHNTIHEVIEEFGIDVHNFFSMLYNLVFCENQGFKLGWVLETIGRDKTLELIPEN